MNRYDMLTVEILSATFQTSQLGQAMLCYQLTESGRLVTPRGFDLAYHGLLHLIGEDGAEFMAIFTHGRLERLDPILDEGSEVYRCLGNGIIWSRDSW
jgi:hypothetical protein